MALKNDSKCCGPGEGEGECLPNFQFPSQKSILPQTATIRLDFPVQICLNFPAQQKMAKLQFARFLLFLFLFLMNKVDSQSVRESAYVGEYCTSDADCQKGR